MAVTSLVVGATTPSGARVVAKVDGAAATLVVADNPALSGAVEFGPVATDAQGVAHLQAVGLDPDTRYWYAAADEDVVDLTVTGTFRTHPTLGEPADFTFWFATCAGNQGGGVGDILAPGRMSNHPVFNTLRSRALGEDWLFGVHGGDLHYYDIGSELHGITSPDIDTQRRAFDDVLAQPNQAGLYRNLSTVYVWDDHDFGPNNSDRTHPLRDDVAQVYRERWPHYPLGVSSGPIFQAFTIGRVLFVASDVRFDRDPNDDAADAEKTMLGSQQRGWLESVLASSDAEFFVWLQPDQWTRASGSDNWSNYTHERDQIAELLGDTGWLHRMLMLQGDRHQVNMDSGANNAWGGFPVYELAPLDSGTSNDANNTSWDIGRHATAVAGGNTQGQYGVIRINDLGDRIEVTGRSYVNTQQVLFHQFSVQIEQPPPPPAPAPEALPAGTVSPVVTWLGCDLVTGRITAELPDMTGDVSRLLGAYTSAHLHLPIPRSGRAALGPLAFQATVPGRSLIVAVVNDQPAWGGIVMPNNAGTGPVADIGCVTLEGYLQRRRVRDHRFDQVDEAEILAALAADAGPRDIPGLGQAGGIGLEIDAPPTGTLRDREYLASDRATVYDRMRELSAVADGPEWTVELLWGDDTHTWVRKVLRIRKRIGIQSSAPAAIFETTAASVFSSRGSSEASYIYGDDYTRGATWVEAYSVGEGEDQPSSAPAIAADLIATGFPIYERHWMPSSSITDIDTLNAHAQRDLAIRRNGSRTWEITARWNVYPRLNVDWRLGDDIAWQLVGHRHPGGVVGQGRAIGWVLDPQAGVVTPILLDPTSDEGEG